MKYLKVFSLFVLSALSVNSQTTFFTGGNICKNEEWKLVFNDEFDNDSLDHSKWITYYPSAAGDDQSEGSRTHGNEGQIYLDSNVVISDGTLKLIARQQTATWFSASRNYTSGMIYNAYPIRFHYGKFDIRCKIPSGMGFWPAFWMFGGDDAGTASEMDVFEFGGQKPNHHHLGISKYSGTIITEASDYSYDAAIDYSLAFHVFTLEWDPFFLTFKVDSDEVLRMSRFYTISGTKVTWCCVEPGEYNVLPAYPTGLNNRVSLIANLAIGTDGGPFTDAPNSSTILPNQFEIDYIRVYQRDSSSDSLNDCSVLLYPNPVHDKLLIKSKKMNQIQIYNILGQEMFSSTVNTDIMQVDVSHFPKGVYFVQVESDHDMLVNKFIKQ